MARNSKVILANGIKMDKNYKSVLCFTEQQMLNLVTSNAISSYINCSYIRDNNYLDIEFSYADCLKANYLAFQNPDYSNKWFFAFINKVEYVSNAVTRVHYTVDVWSTWYDYWGARNCYVIRQHSNTDVAGDNTVPENLEHGEYVLNTYYGSSLFTSYYYVVVASISLASPSLSNPITSFGEVSINGACYLCLTRSDVQSVINDVKAVTSPEQGEILEVYVAPRVLFVGRTVTGVLEITGDNSVYNHTETIFASKPTSLDNVTPVNRKLLTYPYCYILASNMVGNTSTWRYEDFTTSYINVIYWGVPTVGCSIIANPSHYKKSSYISLLGESGFSEALIGAKYPTLGWREDSYTNWLTQNAVNIKTNATKMGAQIVGGGIGLALGIATGGLSLAVAGAGLIASGALSALDASTEVYQHQVAPDSIEGLISAGDILQCTSNLTYHYIGMSIKEEYVRKLDHFFTRYGYRQNDIQMPLFDNYSYRQNYNFVQIATDEVVGVPKIVNNITINGKDMEMINNIFRAGVTIWKNHTNMNDYSVTNNIVTPSPTPTPTTP